jgi:queuine tRNA-ribosyltransferase
LSYYQALMRELRGAIASGRFDSWRGDFYARRGAAVPV